MPWLSIITWLVTFLASYSKTKNAGKSALLATGVAAAAYYTLEPTNPTSIWGDTTRKLFGMTSTTGVEPVDPATVSVSGQGSTVTPKPAAGAPSFGTVALQSGADVLKSWGPLGTMGVVTATGAVTSSSSTKWLWIGGAAIAALILLK